MWPVKIAKIFWLAPLCFMMTSPAYCLERPRYAIDAWIDVANKEVAATQTVTYTNTTGKSLSEIYFHIYANRQYTAAEQDFIVRYGGYFKMNPYPDGFQVSDFSIRSVSQRGRTLRYSIEGADSTLLKVRLNEPLPPGAGIDLSMVFEFSLPHAFGRFGWHENIIKLSRWYPILAVHTEQGWDTTLFYPFHRPFFSEAADYRVVFHVPEDQKVIHTGGLVSVEAEESARKTVTIETRQPVREFSAAFSADYALIEQDVSGVLVKSFYLPGDEQAARKALNDAADLMKYYTELFGPYPYAQFSIAPVHLGYGGEQMSNLIFIDTRVYKTPGLLSRHFDFLIAHETGHQWFYNLVGVDENAQMWLEEGFNSYFIQQYLERKYGEGAEILEFPEWFERYKWMLPELTFDRARDFRYKVMTRIGLDHAVVDKLSSFQEPSGIFSITYGKGSRILGMLKEVIGDEAFNRVFQRIFKEYRYKNLRVRDFTRIAEEESGQKLSWFFDQWLFTDGHYDVAVNGVREGSVILENRGVIKMPVTVAVAYKDGREESFVWSGDKDSERVPLADARAVESVSVDPGQKLLDIDRVNNHWPRIVDVHPVPVYVGLYDLPIFMNEDAYNVVIGPEVYRGIGIKAAVHKPYDQTFYAGTDYEIGEGLHHSRVGYQLNNVLHTQTALGFEISNTTDTDDGDDDVVSGKAYLRRELWPAQYGLGDLNDHVTFYVIRNKNINDGGDLLSSREDGRNIDYSRRNESIAGVALHLDKSGPYPDPVQGYRFDTFAETAGHFMNATQYFNRSGMDVSVYQSLTRKLLLALRLKYGWGMPDDKVLYYLGGPDGLRGFDRKEVRGANIWLSSAEFRFPLKDNIKLYVLDNILGLEKVGGVVFYDGGQSWFSKYDGAEYQHDAGVGLRFTMNIGSFLEKVVVRADVAWPLEHHDDDPQFWFGLNHAF